MQMTDLLAQLGGLQSMARELGVSEGQATQGADALLPALLGGLSKRAQPSGAGGLGALLGQLGGSGLLDDVLSPQPTPVSRGNDVLGQLFGSKDVSRTVAESASAKTGIDPGLLKKMLPILAMLVTGYFARQQASGSQGANAAGGLGGLLGGLLGGQQAGAAAGLAGLLDGNGDGNPLDDILRMAGKMR